MRQSVTNECQAGCRSLSAPSNEGSTALPEVTSTVGLNAGPVALSVERPCGQSSTTWCNGDGVRLVAPGAAKNVSRIAEWSMIDTITSPTPTSTRLSSPANFKISTARAWRRGNRALQPVTDGHQPAPFDRDSAGGCDTHAGELDTRSRAAIEE